MKQMKISNKMIQLSKPLFSEISIMDKEKYARFL